MPRNDTHSRPSMPPEMALERWLRAEQGADELAAEAAFGTLFATLPLPSPSPGFAARTLRAAGLARPSLAARIWASDTIRALLMALLAVAATMAVVLPGVVLPRLAAMGITGLAQSAARGVGGLARWLAGGFTAWDQAMGVGRDLTDLLYTPGAAAAGLITLFVATATFHFLRSAVSQERDMSYATSI